MKTFHFSAFLISCFLFFKCINSTQYKTYSSCILTSQQLWDSDAYSITWNIPSGSSSCTLPLDFLTYRNIDISYTYYGGSGFTCKPNTYSFNCITGTATSCPVVMYSTISSYDSGTIISNTFGSKSVYSDFLKLLYCGAPGMSSLTITIYVYSTSYYWYWTSTWQFIYIGIPVIVLASIILSVGIYICRRNRRNAILMTHQPLLRPTVAITTTTSGSSNMGYQATNQPYYYPQQPQTYNNNNGAPLPPAYNPPVYDQSGYIQAPPMKQ